MFIDTHCHIEKENAKKYVENALNAGVNTLICASEDHNSSVETVEISNEFSNVFSCVGVHPANASEFKDEDIEKFRELIKNNRVKAIGEIGLDYYYGKETKERQIEVFKLFLDLAQENNLPVVIHTREATLDTLNILKEYKLKGVIHCFSGSVETAREYIKLGFSIGIGGVLTFKNSKLYEVVKKVPLSYIILETDAPFLAPEPYRGNKNESKYIPVIAECLAYHKSISLEDVAKETSDNAKRIFDI